MTRAWSAFFAGALSTAALAQPLTLDEALATASSPHPALRISQSELAIAEAERDSAGSRRDFSVFLDGALRGGRSRGTDWRADHVGRIVARKPLLDFGRTSGVIAAAEHDVSAQQALLLGTESQRRLDVMARFFDVLVADLQYAADNEFMAVAYVSWDNARDRHELGQLSQPEMLRLEADYQDVRERRNASQQRMQATRQRLAHAMHRPDQLPSELVDPALPGNDRAAPPYDAVGACVMERNPRVQALQAQVRAAESRIGAIRAERGPQLDAEVVGARYSRELATRDEMSAGLVFNIPLYQGERVDARVAREWAAKERAAAELEQARLELADTLLATLQEIEWLRGSARGAAEKQIEYRDWALERSRAEYELELRTNLGTSMAETQMAQLRRKQVEYRLALAWARLEALCGGSLPQLEGVQQ